MSVNLKLTERDLDNHKFRGLADHGRTILTCSSCGVALVEILLVNPELPVTFKYRADCPHCGDHSFPAEITGQVYMGCTERTIYDGHRDPRPGEPDDIVYLTTSKGKT